MTLVYHMRSSIITQVLGIAVAYPIVLYVTRAGGRPYRRRFVPLLVLLAVLCLLPIYQRLQYHPDYFGRRATLSHGVYHNLLIGLQWNPTLKARYGLGEADQGAARAIEAFVTAGRGAPATWTAIGTNAVTTQAPFNFVDYEEAARDFYLHIWRENPVEVVITMLYWHPLDVYRLARIHAGFTDTPGIDRQQLYQPFQLVHLGVLLVTVGLCSAGGTPLKPGHAVMALIMLASTLLVPLVFYAGDFVNLAEAFVAAGLFTYATLAVGLSHLLTRSTGLSHRP
jgi:hypothetical protein